LKRFWFIGLLSLGTIFVVLPIPYIIRQPQPAQQVVKGVSYESALMPFHMADMDVHDRLALHDLLDKANRKDNAHDRFIALQKIRSIGTDNAYINYVFSNISLNIFTILKKTVRVFDVLLPAVNALHNYFETLRDLSDGATQKTFIRLHQFFIRNLKQLAQQYYGWAIWYKNRGFNNDALTYITLAQALLYRIKDEDPQSLALYKELDTYQPVSFEEEVKLMGIVATGGRR